MHFFQYFKVSLLTVSLLMSTYWLAAQNEQHPVDTSDMLAGHSCAIQARETALENNLTVGEMFALCEYTKDSNWFGIGWINYMTADVENRTYNIKK
ncbi:MAG: hypothetical protein AAF741_14985 [Bacteroidota bacterium]